MVPFLLEVGDWRLPFFVTEVIPLVLWLLL